MKKLTVFIMAFTMTLFAYAEPRTGLLQRDFLQIQIQSELPSTIDSYFNFDELLPEFNDDIGLHPESIGGRHLLLRIDLSIKDNAFLTRFDVDNFVPFENRNAEGKLLPVVNYFSYGSTDPLLNAFAFTSCAENISRWIYKSIMKMPIDLRVAAYQYQRFYAFFLNKSNDEYLVVYMANYQKDSFKVDIVPPITVKVPGYLETNIGLRSGGNNGWATRLYDQGYYVLDDPVDPITGEQNRSALVFMFFNDSTVFAVKK